MATRFWLALLALLAFESACTATRPAEAKAQTVPAAVRNEIDWLHPPKPLIVAKSGGGLTGFPCEDNPVSWALYSDGHLLLIPYSSGCRYHVLQLSASELDALTATLEPVALEKASKAEIQPRRIVADGGGEQLFIWWKGVLHIVGIGPNDRASERVKHALRPFFSRPASANSVWVPPYLLADLRGPQGVDPGPGEAKPWPADWPMPTKPKDPGKCDNLGVWIPGAKMGELLNASGSGALFGCKYSLFVYTPLPGQNTWPDEIRMPGT